MAAGAVWRSEPYRRLAQPLNRLVGPKTGELFEPLGIRTVSDLLHHLPRRYFSGTELSDLSTLTAGEEVAVMAEVAGTKSFNMSTSPELAGRRRAGNFKSRLEATITDRRTADVGLLRPAEIDPLLGGSAGAGFARDLRREGDPVQFSLAARTS
jgi:hypothetical protein